MLWVVLGAIAVVALVVGAVVSGVISVIFAPNRESLSPERTRALTGLGMVAFMCFVVLAATAPGAWFLAPGAIWLVAFSVARNSAPVRETAQQRRLREAAERKRADEEKKRAAARKKVQERNRADAFTKGGLALMDRGRSAVASRRWWSGRKPSLSPPLMTSRCFATPRRR